MDQSWPDKRVTLSSQKGDPAFEAEPTTLCFSSKEMHEKLARPAKIGWANTLLRRTTFLNINRP